MAACAHRSQGGAVPAASLLARSLALLLFLGCGAVMPLGRRPRSDQFLTADQFVAKVLPGMTREAVLEACGEPAATLPGGRALAYVKRETRVQRILQLAVVIPFWDWKVDVTYYQVQGIWFDVDGRVARVRLWDGHDGPHGWNDWCVGYPEPRHLVEWLEKEVPPGCR